MSSGTCTSDFACYCVSKLSLTGADRRTITRTLHRHHAGPNTQYEGHDDQVVVRAQPCILDKSRPEPEKHGERRNGDQGDDPDVRPGHLHLGEVDAGRRRAVLFDDGGIDCHGTVIGRSQQTGAVDLME